jgi:hypothetical protein
MVAAKKKSDQQRQKTVSFRLPEELMEPLRVLAKKNRRTQSGELQIAIEAHLRANGLATPPGRHGPDGID